MAHFLSSPPYISEAIKNCFYHLQIAKEARECIQECVSEFISFITSEASERCQNEKRKTINGEDILYAMCTLGFDNYVDPLTLYLHKYRETTKTDRNIGTSEAIAFDEINSSDFSEFVIRQYFLLFIEPQMATILFELFNSRYAFRSSECKKWYKWDNIEQ